MKIDETYFSGAQTDDTFEETSNQSENRELRYSLTIGLSDNSRDPYTDKLEQIIMASKNVTDCTVSGITNFISSLSKFVISFELSQTSVYSLLEVIYTVYSFICKKLLPKKI